MTNSSFWENKLAVSILKHVIGLILVAVVYFTTWPTPEEPVAWQPPPNPGLTGDYAANERLAAGRYISPPEGIGPEGIDIAADGSIWTGFADGRIVRFSPGGVPGPQIMANTRGRPLGVQFDAQGDLIIADAFRGLMKLGKDGELVTLVDEIDGVPILFADDLDIKSDGTIWFSDASTRFPYGNSISEVMENKPTGRLLIHDPATGQTEVRLEGLSFANGVAFGPDETYVLINETHRHRITRLWLSGPKAGETDYFMDGLPGYPDNITFNGTDTFWITFPSTRSDWVDSLAAKPDFRKILSRVPESLFPLPEARGFVIGVDLDGQVTQNYQDSSGKFTQVTSAIEHDGAIYIGSLENPSVGILDLP